MRLGETPRRDNGGTCQGKSGGKTHRETSWLGVSLYLAALAAYLAFAARWHADPFLAVVLGLLAIFASRADFRE